MKAVQIDTPDDFDSQLAYSLGEQDRVLVHIYASIDEETGKSWCPDCTKAFPFIAGVAAADEGIILQCPAGDRASYRSHCEYKTHPVLQLTALPTLYLFTKVRCG